MLILGAEHLETIAASAGHSAKAVFNENGAIIFAAHLQHCDQKAEGISYEDNYKGNALAAMIFPSRIEIRYHQDFTDQRVARIVAALRREPRLAFMGSWTVTYQGRAVP